VFKFGPIKLDFREVDLRPAWYDPAAALVYAASGVMKVFMFDRMTKDVRSCDALPREAWPTLGIVELIYTVKVIIPAAFRWHPALTWSLPAFWRSRAPCSSGCMSRTARFPPIIMSGARGILLAFIAYSGREMIPSCALRYTVPK